VEWPHAEKFHSVIFGLAELEHLEEAIAAEERGPLPTDGLERIRAVYQEYMQNG